MMGSGKGKSRRSQSKELAVGSKSPAVSKEPTRVAFHPKKWEEFAQRKGMPELGLWSYYCGQPPVGKNHMGSSSKAFNAVVAGLFADAVAVGAIEIGRASRRGRV